MTVPCGPDGLALPRPLSAHFQEIVDPAFRQRATDAWRSASRLRRLMEQWQGWFLQLQTTGDADPGLALLMDEAVDACLRSLYRLTAEISTLRSTPFEEMRDRFPRLGVPYVGRQPCLCRWLAPQPNACKCDATNADTWKKDAGYRQAISERLQWEGWNRLLAELFTFLRELEFSPFGVLPAVEVGQQAQGATAAVPGPTPEQVAPTTELDPEPVLPLTPALLSVGDLAKQLGQPVQRIESHLRRCRKQNPDCYEIMENHRKNEPKYLYRVACVRAALLAKLIEWRQLSSGNPT